jgi:hypothetical protein
MRVEFGQRNLWNDTIFYTLRILPILGDLLTIRPEPGEADTSYITLEAFRLAAVLYISNLREKFGFDTLSASPLYASKLRTLLASSLDLIIPQTLSIWILSVAVTCQGTAEQNAWFTETFKHSTVDQNIISFAVVMDMIIQVVWDEDIWIAETQALRSIFEG